MSSAKFVLARQRVSSAELTGVAHGLTEVAIDTAVADKLQAAWTDSKEEARAHAALPPPAAVGDAFVSLRCACGEEKRRERAHVFLFISTECIPRRIVVQ